MTTRLSNEPSPTESGPQGPVPATRRLMVVGERALAEAVRTATSGLAPAAEVEQALNYLDAMGRLSQRPAAAIIGPAEALAGIEQATARALRQVAPDAKLLVVTDPAQNGQPARMLEAGFDQCLAQPMAPETLAAALGWDDAGPTTGAQRNGQAGAPAASATNGQVAEPAPHTAGPHRMETTHQPQPDQSSAAQPAEAPSAQQASLGDVDLVEAILSETGELREMALAVLKEQSSLANPGLVASKDEAPPGHATVAVTRAGEMYGVLHGEAAPEALHAWAGWLGRWLAMEHQLRRYHELAMRDELTGVWNRRYFHQFLNHVLPRAQRDRAQVTLLVFDIDDFKLYNDNYGHPAGDDILVNVGQLMQSLVRDHDVVARIGGDEFAVIFWEAEGPRQPYSRHPQDVLEVAHRFQDAVCQQRFPKLLEEAAGTLTISGGLASFPWDARDAEQLIAQADNNALTSKKQGKNVITFGPGACRTDAPPSD
jgi:diguanylate cyclase (GGDEF)-like protein